MVLLFIWLQPIEQIQAGDTVKSYDEKLGQTVLQRVAQTFQKTTARLVRLIAGKDTLFATPEHPFYVSDDQPDGSKFGKWVSAMDLKRGLKVLLVSGMLVTIESTWTFDTTATVYNFEVAETHNYFVGQKGFLVHNACARDIKDRLQRFFKKNDSDLIECDGLLDNMSTADWNSWNNHAFATNSDGALNIANTRWATSYTPASIPIADCHSTIAAFFDIPLKPKDVAALTVAISDPAAMGYKHLLFIKDNTNKVIQIVSEPMNAKLHKRCRLPAIKADGVERMNFEIKSGDISKPIYKTWAEWEAIYRRDRRNAQLKYVNIHLDITR